MKRAKTERRKNCRGQRACQQRNPLFRILAPRELRNLTFGTAEYSSPHAADDPHLITPDYIYEHVALEGRRLIIPDEKALSAYVGE